MPCDRCAHTARHGYAWGCEQNVLVGPPDDPCIEPCLCEARIDWDWRSIKDVLFYAIISPLQRLLRPQSEEIPF